MPSNIFYKILWFLVWCYFTSIQDTQEFLFLTWANGSAILIDSKYNNHCLHSVSSYSLYVIKEWDYAWLCWAKMKNRSKDNNKCWNAKLLLRKLVCMGEFLCGNRQVWLSELCPFFDGISKMNKWFELIICYKNE